MSKGTFYEGLGVEYNEFIGMIRFVGEDYITVCVQNGHAPMNDLCIVVYEENWKKVRLLKESHK